MAYGKGHLHRINPAFYKEYLERELAREALRKGQGVQCRICGLSITDGRQLMDICPKAKPQGLHRVKDPQPR